MRFDVIVIGAGAAGMMCAATAGQRGRRVLLIDHMQRIGERIRISGGGRCNFTNLSVGPENYLSRNPHFARSALSRFTQHDFIGMVNKAGIRWHERDHGQLFCNDSATDIIRMLRDACDQGGVRWAQPCKVEQVTPLADAGKSRFSVYTSEGRFDCESLVVATGGLAIPQIGASPFGYRLAEQFGLPVIAPRPALVPLALDPDTLNPLRELAGSTLDAVTRCAGARAEFRENVLITHRGLSGPAILQISSYWQMQDYESERKKPVQIDLLPDIDCHAWLLQQRRSRMTLPNLLAERLPRRFAHEWCALMGWTGPINELSNAQLESIARTLHQWPLMPSGTLGYAKAEVTLGGIDTDALSSRTLETRHVPGLYFAGEVVDVTGWLGGYNFQWAWSSGWVVGQFA